MIQKIPWRLVLLMVALASLGAIIGGCGTVDRDASIVTTATASALPVGSSSPLPVTPASLPPPSSTAMTTESVESGDESIEIGGTVVTPSSTPAAPTPTPATGARPTLAAALPGTSQGFDLVGHNTLAGVGWHAGLALHDHCAYVGNRRSGGASIVDIGDPAVPTVIGTIPFGLEGQPVELRTLPARDLLVAADFGNARLVTYDVADCANPVQVGALEMPGAPHEFYLWTDGERVLIYGAMFDHADADLIVVDVTDPTVPEEVTRWHMRTSDIDGLLHSLAISPDGNRAYLALWSGGVLVAEIDLPEIRIIRDNNGTVHPAPFVAAHSAVPLANAGAPENLLVTSEIWGCPFAQVTIVSIANPAYPNIVARMGLPENRCDNLPAADAIFTPHNPLVVGDLVFLSWYGGGLQVLDVSNPQVPVRVAQFVPAGEGAAPVSYIGGYRVQTWSYPILRDGLLYVVDIQSGLYVLRYTGPGAEEAAGVAHAEGNATVR